MQSIQDLHTFAIDAKASKVIHLSNLEDIPNLFNGKHLNTEIIILGSGSNTVFIDDFDGTVCVNQLKGIEIKSNQQAHIVKSYSGECWHRLVTLLLDKNINGLENLALIPGTVGASPIQNIGAYGVEVKDFIHSVEYFDVVDGKSKSLLNSQCDFGYRSSIFKKELRERAFITSVTFRLPNDSNMSLDYFSDNMKKLIKTPIDLFNKVVDIRRNKLPDHQITPNAGSFFKNPIINEQLLNKLSREFTDLPYYRVETDKFKVPAGYLIEQCGFKNKSSDAIGVHKNQALVIVNPKKKARGSEVVLFSNMIRSKVYSKFGIKLEPEVRAIGRHGLLNDIGVYGVLR